MTKVTAKLVITTHTNADLDGLSSMLAAHRLYPEGVLVIPDTYEPAVKAVLQYPLFSLPTFRTWTEIDVAAVEQIVLVDASEPERLGPIVRQLDLERIRWVVYDTHPVENPDPRIEYHTRPYAATTTLMVEELRHRGVVPGSMEATILALGVFEDTGFFTFVGTRPEDLEAAAFLMRVGADVRVVRDLLQIYLDEVQVRCLHELRENLELLPVPGHHIYFSGIRREKFIPDLALVVHRVMDELPVEVLFVALELPGHVYVIARSRSSGINVGAILGDLGGGGHSFAASASLKGRTLIEVREAILERVRSMAPGEPVAEDIMTRPVRTVSIEATVESAAQLMDQLRVNALPVTANGEVVGLLVRQTMDQALRMGLAQRPVQEMMNAPPPLVDRQADLDTVSRAMVTRRSRLVLVGPDYRHIEGLITRLDLIRARYDRAGLGLVRLSRPMSRPPNYWNRVTRLCPSRWVAYFRDIGEIAETLHMTAYLVGGLVRDVVMERPPQDVDIVVEGAAIPLAEKFAERHGAHVHPFKKYGTAVVVFDDGFRIDFATARTETYESPGAPPRVEVGTMLRQDLFRRDFTINALALNLNPERRGELIDFFGGLRDIHDGVIRVLHALSFFEDPARILRAVRFAARYSFRLSDETEHLLVRARDAGVLRQVPGPRIGQELQYLLAEAHPFEGIRLLIEYRIFTALHSEWRWRRQDLADLRRYVEAYDWYRLTCTGAPEDAWVFWALVLFQNLGRQARMQLAREYHWPGHIVTELGHYREELRRLLVWRRRAKNGWTPGDLVLRIRDWPWQRILYAMAYARPPLRELLRDFFTQWRDLRPLVDGRDLKRLGVPPGPAYRKILDTVLREQINGNLRTRRQALAWLRMYLKKTVPKASRKD